MAAAMSMLVIPFAPGAIAADFNIGVIYFFAILGLSVVGLLVAGWSSYNKYSLLGGLRSAAQMVSYEIPLTLSVVGRGAAQRVAQLQRDHRPPAGPRLERVVAAARLPGLLHRLDRGDQPHPVRPGRGGLGDRGRAVHRVLGDALRFFFFAEYVALFIMSTIVVSLFFGGWLAPWPFPGQLDGFAGTLYGLFWFFLKTYVFVFIAVWMRTTLPRIRVDQLMGVAWKVLLPLSLINLFITAIAVVAFNL